ncbi:MAG: glycosyltransferase family 2 protein [Betaproteobacteria bacterium]|nr:glycosyltransferase family 2 protein [Betaproteobacteria bacterium]
MSQVDVIIPVYNTPLLFLDEALASLRAQSFTDWTAWIINDGSADDYTDNLKHSLDALKDSRVVYLASDHKGPAGSRNVGLVEGAAPYIAFLDSDDCWLPGHLASQVARLEGDSALTLVHGHSRIIDSDSKPLRADPPIAGLNELSVRECFLRMLNHNFVNASSVVARRRALAEVSYFDGSFPCLVDKELWLRLLNRGARFYYDAEVVLFHRASAQYFQKDGPASGDTPPHHRAGSRYCEIEPDVC